MEKDLRNKILNSNILKIIAITAMFIDHASTWFYPRGTILYIILHALGRIVAPIMCYFIAEGYFHTSNNKKYITRLLILTAISHFPYVMYFQLTWWKTTSVIWGLTLGLIALTVIQKPNIDAWKKYLVIAICCILSWTANWNYIVVLWIVFFGIYRGQIKKQMISFAAIGIALYAIPGIVNFGWEFIYRFGVILAIPLLILYNGERGKKSNLIKWGFHTFYPLHLMILFVLRYIVFV